MTWRLNKDVSLQLKSTSERVANTSFQIFHIDVISQSLFSTIFTEDNNFQCYLPKLKLQVKWNQFRLESYFFIFASNGYTKKHKKIASAQQK